MNPIPRETLERANEAAVYNVYLYLVHRAAPAGGETLRAIVTGLEGALRGGGGWTAREIYRLSVLRNAVDRSPFLANSKIGGFTYSQSGLTACWFTNPDGGVHAAFRGTGGGEWLDNGEGLSGIPEENTYLTYGEGGRKVGRETVFEDYATGQQVEALNWLRAMAAQRGWDARTGITLSGHSKGGNKAQFAALHSGLAEACYSFDGQGFSPEALAAFKDRLGADYDSRRRVIWSLSADNDYVNVLGERLMPESQVRYFKSARGLHYMEAMLDSGGRFHPPCGQGRLSMYAERVSRELMKAPPAVRQYATLGVMRVFQRYLGDGDPVGGDAPSMERLINAVGMAAGPLLREWLS